MDWNKCRKNIGKISDYKRHDTFPVQTDKNGGEEGPSRNTIQFSVSDIDRKAQLDENAP